MRAAGISRRARWTSLGTACWGVRALSRHVRACGTALWSRSGSCLQAGLSCGKEVRNLMLHSGKRPGVAILGALRSIITDIRTVVGADPM